MLQKLKSCYWKCSNGRLCGLAGVYDCHDGMAVTVRASSPCLEEQLLLDGVQQEGYFGKTFEDILRLKRL